MKIKGGKKVGSDLLSAGKHFYDLGVDSESFFFIHPVGAFNGKSNSRTHVTSVQIAG